MISDALLIAQVNGETEDLTTLRRMERAAIVAINNRTGRHYGATATITEYLQWKGWPLQLANVPATFTSLKSWDGSAFTLVDASTYNIQGSFVFWNSNSPPVLFPLTMPSRYQAIYTAGYTAAGDVWAAPEDIQQAVLLTVGHWFRNREAVGESLSELPMAVTWILDPYVRVAV